MTSILVKSVEANPIATGIAAFLVGAAIGLSLPENQAENELFGGARDKLLDKARNAAQSIQQKAEDVAASG